MAGRAAVPEVIWARPERTGRGPEPAFTSADIAAAAVRLADAGGLDAVSMRHVAAELGCGTMSLYNYVPRKEDLYELMVDAVSGEHELFEPTGDWRADMLRSARQTRALMHRHAWMARLMSGGVRLQPQRPALPGALPRLPRPAGRPDGDEDRAGRDAQRVCDDVRRERAGHGRAGAVAAVVAGAGERRADRAISAVRSASGAYPRLAASFMEDAGPIDLDAVFERMLERVLDRRRVRGAPRRRSEQGELPLRALLVVVQDRGRPACRVRDGQDPRRAQVARRDPGRRSTSCCGAGVRPAGPAR